MLEGERGAEIGGKVAFSMTKMQRAAHTTKKVRTGVYFWQTREDPSAVGCSCVPLLGLPPVHVVVMRAFEQFGGGGSRICACCELQPCGIRSRDQCGLGSRLGRASELACVHESVHPVVLLRCVDAYILSSRCTHSTRV